MPLYHRLGRIPRKRHMVFPRDEGGIHYEQLLGNKGFTGPSSLLYHLRPPTAIRETGRKRTRELRWETDPDVSVRNRHFLSSRLPAGGSPVLDRTPLLFNADVALSFARPDRHDDFFYRNGQGDELVYLSQGAGRLETQMGTLELREGDYVVIPRGILHRWRLEGDDLRLLIVESRGYVRTPHRYRNEHGQMLEGAPFNERDLRLPRELAVHDETGEFPLLVKQGNQLVEVVLDHHPFDAVGWDGYYYPWAFNIHDFEPLVGRFHLPPPVHQTFEGDGFVVCSFCPRPFDFDPESVPAPYFHANVMSDEVLYYASSEFMSRKGIEYGSLTLHPDGIPHGPHPGRMEASIGQPRTDELAVMVDTFRPLRVAKAALDIEDPEYWSSWRE